MDSFILYTSQYPAIQSLSKAQKGELLDALYLYARDGTVPHFDKPEVTMAFNFIRIRIDENQAKYVSISEKRRRSGRLGGRPKQIKQMDNTKANKANGYIESKKSKCKQKKLTDTESIYTDTLSEVVTTTSQKKEKEKKTREGDFSIDENFDDAKVSNEKWEHFYLSVLSLFNEALKAYASSIKAVRTLTDSRRTALHDLQTKYRYGGQGFKQAFRNVAMSNYCNGRTKDRQRPVDFDWLIKEENFTRAFEGSL